VVKLERPEKCIVAFGLSAGILEPLEVRLEV
jgi:hypothetical protein